MWMRGVLVLCIMHYAYTWIPCGSPDFCFCATHNVVCKGPKVSFLPLFHRYVYRTTIRMDIVDTHIQRLNRLNLNQWKSLRTLFIQNNDFLEACHEERERLLNESRRVSLTMSCNENSATTESPTKFPSIANSRITESPTSVPSIAVSITTEFYTNFSSIPDNVTISTNVTLPQSNLKWISWVLPTAIFLVIIVVILICCYLRHSKIQRKLSFHNPIYLPTTIRD